MLLITLILHPNPQKQTFKENINPEMADLTAKNTATGAIEVPDIERNFRNVLQKYLAGDLTAQDAADRLDRLTPSPRTLVDGKTDPEEALLAFWNVLFNLVGELHDAETTDADPRHRLVNLLSRLAQLDSGTVNIYVCPTITPISVVTRCLHIL